jgi:hypothetical protein
MIGVAILAWPAAPSAQDGTAGRDASTQTGNGTPARHGGLAGAVGKFLLGAAAIAHAGPVERDTRGMAGSLRVDERWVGALVPACLDAWRYFHPGLGRAAWISRRVKVGTVALVMGAHCAGRDRGFLRKSRAKRDYQEAVRVTRTVSWCRSRRACQGASFPRTRGTRSAVPDACTLRAGVHGGLQAGRQRHRAAGSLPPAVRGWAR